MCNILIDSGLLIDPDFTSLLRQDNCEKKSFDYLFPNNYVALCSGHSAIISSNNLTVYSTYP